MTEDTEIKWHVWEVLRGTTHRDGDNLNIAVIPGRKSSCLYTTKDGVLNLLAYFKTEEKAKEACRIIDLIAKGINL
jgi:hypothetical protein